MVDKARALADRILDLERKVEAIKQPSLGHSAIDGGYILAQDDYGNDRATFGDQYDGTNTVAVLTGPKPPTPTIPLVTPAPGALRVYWDGTFANGSVAPMDFAKVLVYARPIGSSGTVNPADPAMIIGQINTATGAEITAAVDPDSEYLIHLVAWSQAGVPSDDSELAFGAPEALLSASDVSAIIGEVTSANGSNVITYATVDPTGKPARDGDTWFKFNTKKDTIIAQWSGVDGEWKPTKVGNEVIANLDIGKLTAGSAQIDTAVTTRLASDMAALKLLTAEKVIVGTGGNLVPDPSISVVSVWGPSNAQATIGATGGMASPTGLRTIAGTGQRGRYTTNVRAGLIPVVPGTHYRFSVWVKPDVDAPAKSFSMIGRALSTPAATSDVLVSPYRVTNESPIPVNIWTEITGMVKIPDGMFWLRIGLYSEAVYTASAMWSDPTVIPAASGTTIVTGTTISSPNIVGGDFYSPDSTSLPRIHMGKSVFEVIRARDDGDTVGRPTVSIGGNSADQMALYDVDGNRIGGFDELGNGVAKNMDVEALRIDGTDINDTLSALPKGVASWWYGGDGTAAIKFGTTEYGLYEMPATLDAGRQYVINYSGLISSTAEGAISLAFRYTYATGDATPGAPRCTSAVIGRATISVRSGYNWINFRMIAPMLSQAGSYRILMTGTHLSGGVGQTYGTNANPTSWSITDEGEAIKRASVKVSSGGATNTVPVAEQTPVEPVEAPQAKTYDRTWNAAWVKSWQDGVERTDYARQGYYGTKQNYSMIGLSSTTIAALKDSSISRLWIYMYADHFYYNLGGYARIALHGEKSAPSTFRSNTATMDSPKWQEGSGKWVEMKGSSWLSGFQNGTIGGWTLGVGAGYNMNYYGKFSRLLTQLKIRAIYEK